MKAMRSLERLNSVTLQSGLLAAARRAGVDPAVVAPPAQREVSLDGLRLRYLDWQGPIERTTVFLHGGGLTAHTWDLVCLALRARFRCVAVDLRGHGDSDWSADGDYGLEAYASDLRGLVAVLECPAPVLIGQSLGGQVAMMAISSGLSASGMGLIDVGPQADYQAVEQIVRALTSAQQFADLGMVVRRAQVLNRRREPDLLRQSLRHSLRQLPNGNWTWKYDRRAFSGLNRETLEQRSTKLWAAVSRIRCSAIVIRGADSQVFSEDHAHQLAAQLASSECRTIPDAGHNAQGDNPFGLAQELDEFLMSCFHRLEGPVATDARGHSSDLARTDAPAWSGGQSPFPHPRVGRSPVIHVAALERQAASPAVRSAGNHGIGLTGNDLSPCGGDRVQG
jgi:pimeloyl-ACP methyl ester carboxylesterase